MGKSIKQNWTNAEVENHVKKMLGDCEINNLKLNDSITNLKIQNSKLSKELAESKKKEKFVSAALTDASQKSKEYEEEEKAKSLAAHEKITQFAFKWKNVLTELSKKSSLVDVDTKTSFCDEIDLLVDEIAELGKLTKNQDSLSKKALSNTVSKDDWYLSELESKSKQKLSSENEKRFNKIISKIKTQMVHADELKKPNESGFDIDEAMNPKDSLDKILGDIMK